MDFLRSWSMFFPNFRANRLYKSKDTQQDTFGSVKVYQKGKGVTSGWLTSGRGSKTPLPKLSVVLDQDPDFFNIPPCSWLAKVLYLLIVTFGVCLIPNFVSNRLFRSGNFCPVCLKVYRNDESDLPMVCCDMCDRWVHTGKGVFTLQTFLLLRYTLRFTEWKIHKNIQISLCYILRSK